MPVLEGVAPSNRPLPLPTLQGGMGGVCDTPPLVGVGRVLVGVLVGVANGTTTALSRSVSTILLRRREGGPLVGATRILPAANSRFIASASVLRVALAALASGSSSKTVGA